MMSSSGEMYTLQLIASGFEMSSWSLVCRVISLLVPSQVEERKSHVLCASFATTLSDYYNNNNAGANGKAASPLSVQGRIITETETRKKGLRVSPEKIIKNSDVILGHLVAWFFFSMTHKEVS